MIAEIDLVIRLLLAIILGSLIGFEREIKDRPAGMRTHILVCIGATLFTIASLSIVGGEPSRIAAGIVTGIGFLGAGAIFRSEDRIRGLTTAADLWALGAIGLAIGIGYYTAAIVATVFILFVLTIGKKIEMRAKKGLK